MGKLKILFLLFTIVSSLSSCIKSLHNETLNEIKRLADNNPDSALLYINEIDFSTLTNYDRHLYNFLKIKINDKLHIKHLNDSLILDVIDYFKSSTDCNLLYIESLYYGGRVYSDMGNYPEALQYYHQVLELLPDDTPNHLRGRTLSQLGYLLNKLRLYNESIPYIVEAIKLERDKNDTISLVSNLNFLGDVQIHLHDYNTAKTSFQTALTLSKNLPPKYRAKSRMYMADIYSKTNNPDSALICLKESYDSINKGAMNTFFAIAVLAYYNAGMYDSTYVYAKRLIHSKNEANKQTGYHFLLLPELKKYSKPDSLIHYTYAYSAITDKYFDNNQNNLSLLQRAQYNYDKQLKARLNINKENRNLKMYIITLSVIMLILIILLINSRYKNKNIINNLLKSDRSNVEDSTRLILQNEILDRIKKSPQKITPGPILINSTAYKNLEKFINSRQIIRENNPIWKELEVMLLGISPQFINTLKILASGKITTTDLQTVILVKCFVSPKDMEILLGRSKGTIVSRRQTLSKKLFDTVLKTETIDKAIRLL